MEWINFASVFEKSDGKNKVLILHSLENVSTNIYGEGPRDLGTMGNSGSQDVPNRLEFSKKRAVNVVKTLAEGGFSTVFVCEDEQESGSKRALKRILTQNADQESDALREIRVHRILGGINPFPNVIPLLGSQIRLSKKVDKGKEVYLLFPLYERSLLDVALGGVIKDENKLLTIFRGVCLGVQALHMKGLSHRDMKPANVLLDANDDPVVMDFGSCDPIEIHIKSRAEALAAEERAQSKSSAPFRAPELWYIPSSCVIDGAKTDIWSLGCLLYAITFGEGYSPFESKERGLEPLAIRNGTVKYDKTSPFFNKRAHQLIERILKVDPVKRPKISEIVDFLDEIN